MRACEWSRALPLAGPRLFGQFEGDIVLSLCNKDQTRRRRILYFLEAVSIRQQQHGNITVPNLSSIGRNMTCERWYAPRKRPFIGGGVGGGCAGGEGGGDDGSRLGTSCVPRPDGSKGKVQVDDASGSACVFGVSRFLANLGGVAWA